MASCLVPPPATTSALAFEAKILGGLAVTSMSGWWLYHRQQLHRGSSSALDPAAIT